MNTRTDAWLGIIAALPSGTPIVAPPGVYSIRGNFQMGAGAMVHTATVRIIP